MKLNLDCVRDILLCVEENTGLRKMCLFVDSGLDESAKFVGNYREPMEYQKKLLEKHDNDTLIYHINYCVDAELLVISTASSNYIIVIADLTPTGHELLGRIRDNTIWRKIKETLAKCNINTIAELIPIAKAIGGEPLNAALRSMGLPTI